MAKVLNLSRVQGQQGVQSFSNTLSGSVNKSSSRRTAIFPVNDNYSQICTKGSDTRTDKFR